MNPSDARPPVPPGPDREPDDDELLAGVLRVHPDDLVDFTRAFFAAMEALGRGPSGLPADPGAR